MPKERLKIRLEVDLEDGSTRGPYYTLGELETEIMRVLTRDLYLKIDGDFKVTLRNKLRSPQDAQSK